MSLFIIYFTSYLELLIVLYESFERFVAFFFFYVFDQPVALLVSIVC